VTDLPLPPTPTAPSDRYAFYARVAGSTAYLTVALATTNAALFGCDVVLARSLTPRDYGLVIYLTGLVTIVLNLSDLGLSRYLPSALASALAQGETGRANRTCGNALVIQVIAACALAAVLGGLFFRAPSAIEAVRRALGAPPSDVPLEPYVWPLTVMFGLWVLIFSVTRLITAVYDGYQQMRYSFLAALVRDPVRLVVLAVAMVLAATLDSALWGQALSALPILVLSLILLALFRRANPAARFALGPSERPALVRDSLYYFVPSVGLWLFPELVKVTTGTFDVPETVGRLKICLGLASLAFVALAAVQRAFLPAFSEKASDKPVLQASFLGLVKVAGLLSFLVFAGMVTVGPYLVRLVFGPQYSVDVIRNLLVVLSLAAFFEGYRLVTEPLLQGTGHFRILGVVEFVRLAVFIVLAAVMIPRWSGVGAAAAIAGAALLAWALRFILVHRRVVRVPWPAMIAVAALVSAIAGSAVLRWTAAQVSLIAVAAGVMVLQFSRGEAQTLVRSLRLLLRKK
jgi:O-antigen/teichoic acid export membrane protein